MPRERITVLVATGLHRPNEGEELAEVVGDPWVLRNGHASRTISRATRKRTSTSASPSGRRTPVKLDRRFVEADLRIATGLVEPHFMAGWSGGRKVIAPGIAHEDTIRTFHSARFMEDPLAIQCNLDGNPLHEEQLEIVRMLGEVYALNTVIDDDRDLVHVNFGEVIASHLETVRFVADTIRVPVGRRFKTILTSAAGHPLDKTYYQTVKGMVTPLDILEPGGTLIVASACSEGFGSLEFRDAQTALVRARRRRVPRRRLLAKQFADIDEWQTQMQLKSMRAGRVKLYTTGLDDDERALTGVRRRSRRSKPRSRRRSRPRATARSPSFPKDRMSSPWSPDGPTADAGSLAIHLDLVGGIAGDMFVAAMVDALPVARAAGAGRRWRRCSPPGRRARIPEFAGGCERSDSAWRRADERSYRSSAVPHASTSRARRITRHRISRCCVRTIVDARARRAATREHALALLALLAEAEAQVHGTSLDARAFPRARRLGFADGSWSPRAASLPARGRALDVLGAAARRRSCRRRTAACRCLRRRRRLL